MSDISKEDKDEHSRTSEIYKLDDKYIWWNNINKVKSVSL